MALVPDTILTHPTYSRPIRAVPLAIGTVILESSTSLSVPWPRSPVLWQSRDTLRVVLGARVCIALGTAKDPTEFGDMRPPCHHFPSPIVDSTS